MRNQKGFGTVEVIAVLVVATLISLAGWYLLNSKASTSKSLTPLASSNSNLATIVIADKATNQPLGFTDIEFSSTNGANCSTSINSSCPNNPKKWKGTTDRNGVIKISSEYIQKSNEILKKKTFNADTVGYEPIAHFDASGVPEPNDPVTIKLTLK
ncbi:MAG: hypothetical protein ABI602_04870 [Candidatus Saccharibacteria bacterium]